MKRVVSVWSPDWPITVWMRRETHDARPPPDGAPFALVERGPRGLTLSALNPAARAVGLRTGQSHADARAILPTLASAPAEPEADLEALRRLALWAERFSPLVSVDVRAPGQEGLLIDMTGGAHLFGGEAALLADIRRRLTTAGIPARLAIADTAAAAWALARFAVPSAAEPDAIAPDAIAPDAIAPVGRAREALAALPVEGLGLEADALVLLKRFGLKRIGDLYALPRAGLARRFRGPAGLRVVERLDQALGVLGEAMTPERPAPLYRVWTAFAEPVIDHQGVGFYLPGLARGLCEQLRRDGRGARRLVLTGFRVDGRVTRIDAGLSAPAAAPEHLVRLLREKGLEHLDLGFGVDALMLSADKAEAMGARQLDMAQAPGADRRESHDPSQLSALIDRLQARLGEGAVRRPRARESWIPERGEIWVPAEPDPPPAGFVADRPRPILLLERPEPVETLADVPDGAPARFIWRRVTHRVIKAEGPERLSAEWWRADAGAPRPARTRDYYRVEDDQGRRYWLYREGLYARQDADLAPVWWLHGVFA